MQFNKYSERGLLGNYDRPKRTNRPTNGHEGSLGIYTLQINKYSEKERWIVAEGVTQLEGATIKKSGSFGWYVPQMTSPLSGNKSIPFLLHLNCSDSSVPISFFHTLSETIIESANLPVVLVGLSSLQVSADTRQQSRLVRRSSDLQVQGFPLKVTWT